MDRYPDVGYTHGQPASPTRLGKEVMVFVYRLEQQLALLKVVPSPLNSVALQETSMRIMVAYPNMIEGIR